MFLVVRTHTVLLLPPLAARSALMVPFEGERRNGDFYCSLGAEPEVFCSGSGAGRVSLYQGAGRMWRQRVRELCTVKRSSLLGNVQGEPDMG